MLAKKKLQLTKDMRCNLFFAKVDQLEKGRKKFWKWNAYDLVCLQLIEKHNLLAFS
jgi:hypothetical protein